MEPCRKIRVFTEERYLSIDCSKRDVKAVRLSQPQPGQTMGSITGEPITVAEWDPLEEQMKDFAQSIRETRKPLVCGDAGKRALELACAIKDAMTNPASGISSQIHQTLVEHPYHFACGQTRLQLNEPRFGFAKD